ncbi:MAG: HAMP domain-containing sensor histidine kinase, partial [Patescibacteria group bacterium]
GDTVVGVLTFFLLRKGEEVSSPDMEMMSAISREIGIALERSQFYERLKAINGKLQVANEHLKELDRAKSEFMSIASHQLRTPLSGIMGYLSMILDGDYGKLKKEQKEIIDDVFEATQRLIRLVNVFLNVTRIEAGRFILNFAKIDMKQLIEDEINELQPTADKKNIKLAYKKPKEKIPEMVVDPDKIKDVVLNLVDNAIKYTKEGSITVGLKMDGKKTIHVTIKDTGVGIEPEDAKNLFDKFVRGSGIARVQPDGSGLGLFIARKITEAHNGKIWVESKGVGKGSVFHFTLPIEDKKLEPKKITLKKVKS